jgi:hypothetical protein
MARRVKPPTSLTQWGCQHHWQVRHTHRYREPLPRKRRHYKCRSCGVAMVTEEQPVMAWDEGELLAQVKALLPVQQPVYLRDQGITELPLYGLNALLKKHGLLIQARKVRNQKKFVRCTDKHGQTEVFGLFILEPIKE